MAQFLVMKLRPSKAIAGRAVVEANHVHHVVEVFSDGRDRARGGVRRESDRQGNYVVLPLNAMTLVTIGPITPPPPPVGMTSRAATASDLRNY